MLAPFCNTSILLLLRLSLSVAVPLGRKDGNVYVHYFEQVKRSNPQGEHPYFNRLIKPLIDREVEGGDYEDEEAGLESEDEDDE
ncbi:hypothetical protein G6F42_019756 [Rhizopus arrhizus]|nr:hypothetical protein G6F42_019756 [Rhizopus arrhizus]